MARLIAWWRGLPVEPGTARAVRALDLDPEHRVLDLLCGEGGALPRLLGAVPEGMVVGFDEPGALEEAGRHFEPWVRAGRLQLLSGATGALPVPDASVDAVLALRVERAWSGDAPESRGRPEPGMRALAAELARVVGPSGRLVMTLGERAPSPTADRLAHTLRDVGFSVAIDDTPDGAMLLVASPIAEVRPASLG